MDCDRPNDAARELSELVTSLHELLEKQVAAGREGDLSRVEQLAAQADAVVAQIVRHQGDVSAALEARRPDLKRLYDELTLTLRAEQSDVQSRLKQLRRVKRAVGAYRTDR